MNLSEAELKNQELMQQIEQLKKENYYLAMRNDVLEEINKLLKKEKGINHNHLTNQEKTQLIDALKDKYSEVKVKITKIFKQL